jgi:predicted nucleotidyltransferase
MSKHERDLETSLRDAVASIEHQLDPAAVLLFGSAVAGRLGPDSDVDLAVLLGHDPPDAC